MKTRNSLALGCTFFLLAACGSSSDSEKETQVVSPVVSIDKDNNINVLSDAEKAEGWKLLFDGKSTDGWHNYLKDNIEGWQANDGLLSTPGKQGDIVTDREYENFELIAEWKIEEQGNSGIFYHVVEDAAYPRMHETGPEFQIIDEANYPVELTENQKTGANSDVLAPNSLAANPPGEWNHTRIFVQQGKVEFWLNRKKITTYDMESAEWQKLVADSKFAPMHYAKVRKGRIGLQDHGGPVSFRNLKIKEL